MRKTPQGSFTPKETRDLIKLKERSEADFIVHSLSIMDPKIVIAGGYFTSRILKTLVNDIDVFILCSGKEMPAPDMMKIMQPGVMDVTKSQYTDSFRVFELENYGGHRIQYIFRSESTREELIAGFDYEHCKVSYCEGKLYVTPKTYRAIQNKTLIPTPGIKPKQYRTKKFLDMGFIESIVADDIMTNAFG